jgi:hypothetical protein
MHYVSDFQPVYREGSVGVPREFGRGGGGRKEARRKKRNKKKSSKSMITIISKNDTMIRISVIELSSTIYYLLFNDKIALLRNRRCASIILVPSSVCPYLKKAGTL